MNVYYWRLKKLWDELQNYSQLPVGEVGSILARGREEEQIYQFLIGLNDDIYNIVRSSIIQEVPSPKLKSTFARICKEE